MSDSTRVMRLKRILFAVILAGVALLISGTWMFRDRMRHRDQIQIRRDAHTARIIYDHRIETIQSAMEMTALASDVQTALALADAAFLTHRLERIARSAGLHFAGAVTPDGRVLCRIHPGPGGTEFVSGRNPAADLALSQGETVAGTVALDRGILQAENPALAERARISVRSPEQGSVPLMEEDAGLGLCAAAVVKKDSKPVGAIYGGMLLNRDESLVDEIGEALFPADLRAEGFAGTVALYFRNLRVAVASNGESVGEPTPRSLGRSVPPETARRVLIEGETWVGPGIGDDADRIAAIQPLADIFSRRVGMLYVSGGPGR